MTDTSTAVEPARKNHAPEWLIAIVAVFFALFYAYSAWAAVGNLVGLNLAAQDLDTSLSPFGWGLLILGVLLPIAVFALAFRLGRRRNIGVQALLFLTGLALVSALAIDTFMFGLGSLLA
jgi:hypothetical protein